jgi:hypothetical protein
MKPVEAETGFRPANQGVVIPGIRQFTIGQEAGKVVPKKVGGPTSRGSKRKGGRSPLSKEGGVKTMKTGRRKRVRYSGEELARQQKLTRQRRDVRARINLEQRERDILEQQIREQNEGKLPAEETEFGDPNPGERSDQSVRILLPASQRLTPKRTLDTERQRELKILQQQTRKAIERVENAVSPDRSADSKASRELERLDEDMEIRQQASNTSKAFAGTPSSSPVDKPAGGTWAVRHFDTSPPGETATETPLLGRLQETARAFEAEKQYLEPQALQFGQTPATFASPEYGALGQPEGYGTVQTLRRQEPIYQAVDDLDYDNLYAVASPSAAAAAAAAPDPPVYAVASPKASRAQPPQAVYETASPSQFDDGGVGRNADGSPIVTRSRAARLGQRILSGLSSTKKQKPPQKPKLSGSPPKLPKKANSRQMRKYNENLDRWKNKVVAYNARAQEWNQNNPDDVVAIAQSGKGFGGRVTGGTYSKARMDKLRRAMKHADAGDIEKAMKIIRQQQRLAKDPGAMALDYIQKVSGGTKAGKCGCSHTKKVTGRGFSVDPQQGYFGF